MTIDVILAVTKAQLCAPFHDYMTPLQLHFVHRCPLCSDLSLVLLMLTADSPLLVSVAQTKCS